MESLEKRNLSHDFYAPPDPRIRVEISALVILVARYIRFYFFFSLPFFSRLPETTARFPSDQRRLNAALENGTPVAGHPQHLRPDHHLLPVRREENSSSRVGYPEASRHAVHAILACKVDKRHSIFRLEE